MHPNKTIIVCATVLQLITALFIIFTPIPLRIAQLGAFYDFFPTPFIGAVLMLLAVIFACIGLYIKESPYRFLFFVPQHGFLLLTAGSSLHYILQSQYADGVSRPWQFIFIDQLLCLIVAIIYTVAIFDFRRRTYVTKT